MGDTCTRACRFCAVKTSSKPPPLEPNEPENVANAILAWKLGYVVLTVVTRDDLCDGGAKHIANTVKRLKSTSNSPFVEVLTSDFAGNIDSVRTVVDSGLDVYAHNLETVKDLQHIVRDRRAGYEQSLNVLKAAKVYNPSIITKTSLMLGCGENDAQILQTLKDLRAIDCDVVTFGQYVIFFLFIFNLYDIYILYIHRYLRPTERHMKVVEYIKPEKFLEWKHIADDMNFLYTASGPLVRSSYRAGEFFLKNVLEKRRNSSVSQ